MSGETLEVRVYEEIYVSEQAAGKELIVPHPAPNALPNSIATPDGDGFSDSERYYTLVPAQGLREGECIVQSGAELFFAFRRRNGTLWIFYPDVAPCADE